MSFVLFAFWGKTCCCYTTRVKWYCQSHETYVPDLYLFMYLFLYVEIESLGLLMYIKLNENTGSLSIQLT